MRLLVVVFVLAMFTSAVAQDAPKQTSHKVPKYNAAAEAVYKGTVDEMRDHQCPVSGGMGAHIMLKLGGGEVIEVHLSTTNFTKMIEMNLQKGVAVEVTGWKTEFEGVPTIFARVVKHGVDTYTFRSEKGDPAWIY